MMEVSARAAASWGKVILFLSAAFFALAAGQAAVRAEAPVPAALGTSPAVNSVRLGDHGKSTRFVIELAQPVKHKTFTLADPYRVVIDLPEVEFNLPQSAGQDGRGFIKGYRYGLFQAGQSRIVIDTTVPVAISKDFALDPQSGFGYRIVLDLTETTRSAFLQGREWPAQPTVKPPVQTPVPVQPAHDTKRVVVIDPGHGGVDPGTHGSTGVQEKDVVLAFAKELHRQLAATGRYHVRLTRDTDRFIPLRQRVAIARQHKADLFISIHADAVGKGNVRGMSVYTLSETSSDKEAAELARKENLSDVIAGVDLYGEPGEVTDILIDLAQRETKNFSANFARKVVDYAGKSTKLLQRTHRFAGFRVLKAPDVPSVLVELGFLTNRSDEKNLMSAAWRTKVAGSLVRAVDSYFGDRYAEGVYAGPAQ
ncbi:N-acetylmuramoyl-L-alanine amidase [Tepidicaulis marinus]|uniref:N-acetylmuramoyl-L-alanine amidase n=1 Tax=Tepidicaulis marinus TaxID=1333998 RepID=UPI0009DD9D39|nr:N-acetylmuramoyl-L-alanine amidase [Tepidicaulis marinus]